MQQDQFLDVASVQEARRRWEEALDLGPLAAQELSLENALGRVLAHDVRAPGDVPGFDRSNVDGFAVDAAHTFGATEREPVTLPLQGQAIQAGHPADAALRPGHARAIATGAALPRGANAVVLVEETESDAVQVRIRKAVAPGAAIAHAGSDIARGEVVLRAGTLLTARETGTLAACGIARVSCVPAARVAILSTGNEIVPAGQALRPAQVHDANATLLGDAVRELGGTTLMLGIARDEEVALRTLLERARREADLTLISGGTSKGSGDLSYRVLARSAQVLVHGVALKPGKPVCLAAWDRRPVAVLPGFPTSAIFTFHTFVAPLLLRLMGRPTATAASVRARVLEELRSEPGRREFCLVSLVRGREGLLAFPLGKGSGSVTTFARADGFLTIDEGVEQVEAGSEVVITQLGRDLAPADLVLIGSHCTGLDVILSHLQLAHGAKVLHVGSHAGVRAVAQGACDLAPVHLLHAPTGEWNVPFAPKGVVCVRGYGRLQSLAFRSEQAALFAEGSVEEALRRAAADPALRLANRNPASGTRVLLDEVLGASGPDAATRPTGWEVAYRSHTAVAAAISQARADYGVCLETVARAQGLLTRPWREERYDFLVPAERMDTPAVAAFRAALLDPQVQAALRAEGFSP